MYKKTQKDTKRHKKTYKHLKSDNIFTKRHKNTQKQQKISKNYTIYC